MNPIQFQSSAIALQGRFQGAKNDSIRLFHNSMPQDQARFSGTATRQKVYQAIEHDIKGIQDSLTGWHGNPNILGVEYLPPANAPVIQGLHRLISNPDSISSQNLLEGVIKELAEYRTNAYNLQSLILGEKAGTLHPSADSMAEARVFISQLQIKMAVLHNALSQPQYHISPAGIKLFDYFVARTAPTLFIMGYGDAVDHCSDVSRLALQEAYHLGDTGPKALQAALVGWIHDPKLRSDLSFSNLATHPLVASAVANAVFNEPEMRALVSHYLAESKVKGLEMGQNIAQALSINNDSEWVNRNVILGDPDKPIRLPYAPLAQAEPGILGFLHQPANEASPVYRSVLNRLFAIKDGVDPDKIEDIPSGTARQIATTSLSTGLRGIDLRQLPKSLAVSRSHVEKVIQGKGTAEEAAELRSALAGNPKAIVDPRVNGLSLMSNALEVPEGGRNAALALDIADQKLLSYHKLVSSGQGETAMIRLASYLGSMRDNINNLPQQAHANGKIWLRDVFKSILVAASRLTHQPNLISALDSSKPLEQQIDDLEATLKRPSIWQMPGGIDYGALRPDQKGDPNITRLIDALKAAYDEAANVSPGMFGHT